MSETDYHDRDVTGLDLGEIIPEMDFTGATMTFDQLAAAVEIGANVFRVRLATQRWISDGKLAEIIEPND